MTPRDKATEVFRRFWQAENKFGQQSIYRGEAIACALICVDELINETHMNFSDRKSYWEQVKEEINKI